MVRREDVLAYLDRPWDLIRESKDRYTASLVEQHGPDAAFDLATKLASQAASMGLEPSAAQRKADLATAVRLRRMLDRAERRARRHR